MIETLFSLVFVYVFILLGYLAKRLFKEDMNPKTLTLFSVYFLQPFVTVWGFSTAKLHSEHIFVPLVYLGIILALLASSLFVAKLLFEDAKERAIFSIAGFVGNTGNIGIPLGIALFGEQSVIYTTLINIANVFVVYIIGVYIYSRGSFSVKNSLLNIVKIPIIPASAVAFMINIYDIPLSSSIREFFKMGAYAGIVLQLFLAWHISARHSHSRTAAKTLYRNDVAKIHHYSGSNLVSFELYLFAFVCAGGDLYGDDGAHCHSQYQSGLPL